MNTIKSYIIGFSTVLFFAGCAQQQAFEVTDEICVENFKKINTMRIAEEVISDMHFTVEKSDPNSGYIKSRPLVGAQFFEFWRDDNVGAFNSAEANLHSIRRIVELDMSQRGEKVCVGCNVNVQRLSLSERKRSSSARAYDMFSKSSASLQRLKLDSKQKAWLDLGQDPRLATTILKRIEKQIAKLREE